MPRNIITIEGEVVPDEDFPNRPAINDLNTPGGRPTYIGGIFDAYLMQNMGVKVRIKLDVVAVRNPQQWKKV